MRRAGCLGAGRDLGRMLTAGQALARLQSCAPSPVSCLAFASACVGLVLSRCVALMSYSHVDLRILQSTFMLTYPKLHMYALL